MMKIAYTLMVVFGVHGPIVKHDYGTQAQCERALAQVNSMIKSSPDVQAACLPPGE